MRICSHSTGSQHAPATTYSAIDTASHVLEYGKPARCARYTPVIGCTITAGVVNSQSASTTRRTTK
jgi:hypothetical protein